MRRRIGSCVVAEFAASLGEVLGEVFEGFLEGLDVDGVEEIPDHLARAGLDEAVGIKPLITVLDPGDRALALARPGPARDRFQGEAVLVEDPDLDRGARVGRLGLVHRSLEFFKRRLVFRARRPLAARPRRLPGLTSAAPASERLGVAPRPAAFDPLTQ